jgi:hypothetical protein
MFKLVFKHIKFPSKFLHASRMPAFTLYSSRGSTNTDRVRLTLAEGGFTDFDTVMLDLAKGEQKVRNMYLRVLKQLRDRTHLPANKNHQADNVPRPRRTSSVTRGVKFPPSNSPTDLLYTRVA